MTFRIRRSASAHRVVFALSGEMAGDQLTEFGAFIDRETPGVVALDLADVTLVDREAVRFIRRAVARGADLVNCPPYIRRWIAAERDEA